MKSEEVILTSAKAVCTLETGAQVVASWRQGDINCIVTQGSHVSLITVPSLRVLRVSWINIEIVNEHNVTKKQLSSPQPLLHAVISPFSSSKYLFCAIKVVDVVFFVSLVFVNFLSPRYGSRLYSLNNKSISDSLRPLENFWVGGRSPKIIRASCTSGVGSLFISGGSRVRSRGTVYVSLHESLTYNT